MTRHWYDAKSTVITFNYDCLVELAYAEAKSRVTGGLASSRIFELKAANMLARRYAPGFRIGLRRMDLGIGTAAARDAGVAIPLGATAAQLMGALRAQGNGGLDHSALQTLIETLSGRRPA